VKGDVPGFADISWNLDRFGRVVWSCEWL